MLQQMSQTAFFSSNQFSKFLEYWQRLEPKTIKIFAELLIAPKLELKTSTLSLVWKCRFYATGVANKQNMRV